MKPMIERIQAEYGIIGRGPELELLLACIAAGRHVLLEGPVGVGKTAIARAVAGALGRGFVRVDGDGRYTESRLVGQFDPPRVLEQGYVAEAFAEGPLLRAMRTGAVLLVNELNRMPEGVQNVLLPAMDEGLVHVPHLGETRAAPGFAVIATQNPAEFVATGDLSEALMDRFELVKLGWQSEAEERLIVLRESGASTEVVDGAVRLVRATREDPRIRRGASVRAAIAVARIASQLDGDVVRAAAAALPTRIELQDERATPLAQILDDLKKKAQG